MLAFELLNEVVDETVVEVLTTQVSVSGSGLDLEDTLLNGQEGDIESSSTKIEDENVALTLDLLVKTVRNGSGSWLVDDSENVETSNQTGILSGLTLSIVEIGGDSDDGIGDFFTEVNFSVLRNHESSDDSIAF